MVPIMSEYVVDTVYNKEMTNINLHDVVGDVCVDNEIRQLFCVLAGLICFSAVIIFCMKSHIADNLFAKFLFLQF